jgi:hypothetical protein
VALASVGGRFDDVEGYQALVVQGVGTLGSFVERCGHRVLLLGPGTTRHLTIDLEGAGE